MAIEFTCPGCEQFYSVDGDLAGCKAQCDQCGTKFIVPTTEPKPTDQPIQGGTLPAEPSDDPVVQLKSVVDVDIKRSGMTISQLMSQRGLEGGVKLQDSERGSRTPSAILTDKEGRKYDIGKLVAKGGMGAILEAKDLNIRRRVAMKVMLNPKQADDAKMLRFIEEAQVTGQLEHPSIVPVHELGVDAHDNVFYTMKFVKGITLKDIIEGIAEGKHDIIAMYPLSHLLNIFLKTCDALAFAHRKNVIHRDLKPENLMVGEFGEVLVMDWGLAKVLGGDKQEKEVAQVPAEIESARADAVATGDTEGLQTLDGQVMGTPFFMAPEQALGKIGELDARTDIYSLGAILYNILTLRPPVGGTNLGQVLLNVAQGKIVPPTQCEYGEVKASSQAKGKPAKKGDVAALQQRAVGAAMHAREQPAPTEGFPHCPNGVIPPALSAIAMKALGREPDARYQTVKQLQADIERFQGGFATVAEQAGLARQLALLVKRHKGFVTAAAVVFLAVTVGLVVSVGQWRKAVAAQQVAMANEQAALTAKAAEQKLREAAEYDAYVGRLAMAEQRIADCAYDQAEALLAKCPGRYRHWEWQRLKFLCKASELTIPGNPGQKITSACFSPDGKWIATSTSQWGTVALWDARTGEAVKQFRGGWVSRLCFNTAGTLLAMSADREVRIWDIEKDECRQTLRGHTAFIQGVAFSGDGAKLLTGAEDGHVVIWDVATGERLLDWTPGESCQVWAVALSPSGDRIVAGGGWTEPSKRNDPNIWVVNTDDGGVMHRLKERSWVCSAVAWSPDGRLVATGGYVNVVCLWNPNTGDPVREFDRRHTHAIHSIRFSKDGSRILTGSADRTAKVWDVATGKEVAGFAGHADRVWEANWSPDERRIVTASFDGTARVWLADLRSKTMVVAGYMSGQFSPDSARVATGFGLWDARNGRKVSELQANCVSYSHDGNLLAAGRIDGSIRVWDGRGGTLVRELKGHANIVFSVAFSPDSRRLASCAQDGTIRLWSVADGKEIWQVTSDPTVVSSGAGVAFTPDGARIVSNGRPGALSFIDVASHEEVWSIPAGAVGAFACDYAPDGKTLLVRRDDTVAVLDASTGETRVEFRGHAGLVRWACYSPDGLRVATGGEDTTLRVWDARTGRGLLVLRGHEGPVYCVDWSPDGKSILSTSNDNTARIWLTE